MLSPGDLEPRSLPRREPMSPSPGWPSPGGRGPRGLRRRRSAPQMPALVAPADIPDDAAGRVDCRAVHAPEDVIPEHVPDAGDAADRLWERLRLRDYRGWIAVAVVALLLAAVLLAVLRVS